MKAALALILALGAPPAMARAEMPPDCYYSVTTGKILPPMQAGRRDLPVFVFGAGAGVIQWSVVGDGNVERLLVLQHCASGRELAVTVPTAGQKAILARWTALVDGEGKYTMAQLGQEMRRLGARTQDRRGLAFGPCACEASKRWR